MRMRQVFESRVKAGCEPVVVTSPEEAAAQMVAAGFRSECFAVRLVRAGLRVRGWADPVRLGPDRAVIFVLEGA